MQLHTSDTPCQSNVMHFWKYLSLAIIVCIFRTCTTSGKQVYPATSPQYSKQSSHQYISCLNKWNNLKLKSLLKYQHITTIIIIQQIIICLVTCNYTQLFFINFLLRSLSYHLHISVVDRHLLSNIYSIIHVWYFVRDFINYSCVVEAQF